MYEEKGTMEEGLSEAEKEYYASRGEIDEIEKALRQVQHNRQNIDTVLMQLQTELSESKLELNSVKERLSVEFKVDGNLVRATIVLLKVTHIHVISIYKPQRTIFCPNSDSNISASSGTICQTSDKLFV